MSKKILIVMIMIVSLAGTIGSASATVGEIRLYSDLDKEAALFGVGLHTHLLTRPVSFRFLQTKPGDTTHRLATLDVKPLPLVPVVVGAKMQVDTPKGQPAESSLSAIVGARWTIWPLQLSILHTIGDTGSLEGEIAALLGTSAWAVSAGYTHQAFFTGPFVGLRIKL